MRKSYLLLLISLLFCFQTKAQQLPEISDSAEFYLLTCEPGEISYEKFGHTGIRVVDKGLDITINWGVFSFDAPNFILRFVKGETDYMVDAWSTEGFLSEYRERGSVVYQNHINFDSIQKRQLWERLQVNFRPENRTYRYNFIYDNCATRAYTIILHSADSVVLNFKNDEIGTYRVFVNRYAKADTWLSLGINFVFGADADIPVNVANLSTFPIQAMQLLTYTTMKNDTARVPVIGKEVVLFNGQNQFKDKETNQFVVFLMFICPLLILGLFIFMFVRKRKHYWFIPTQIVLWLTVLFSLILIFLIFFSSHPLVQHNYNMLWCNPLNGVLAVVLFMKGHKRIKAYLSMLSTALSIIFIFLFTIGVQGSTPPLMGITLMVFGIQALVMATYLPYLNIKRFKRIHQHHHHHRHTHHHHHHHHKHEETK